MKSLLIYLIILCFDFSSFLLDDNNAKPRENVMQTTLFFRKQVFHYFCEAVPRQNENSCREIKHLLPSAEREK